MYFGANIQRLGRIKQWIQGARGKNAMSASVKVAKDYPSVILIY